MTARDDEHPGPPWAVVLACGADAVPSHRSAAGAWGIRPDGPTTTVAHTLLNLAAVVPAHHLRRAVERAEDAELFDLAALQATIDAHPRRPGRRRLVALLAELREHDLARTRSDVEAASTTSPGLSATLSSRSTATPSTAAARPSRTTAPATAPPSATAGASRASRRSRSCRPRAPSRKS